MIARLTMRPAAARRIGRYMLAALVALAMTTAAHRASAQAAQPSPTAILLAKQLVEIKHIKDIYVPLVRGVVEKTRDMFMQTNFMWSKDLNDVTDIEFKQYVPRASELVDETARIYATHFTEPELKQLLAFYQSPVGQKALVEEPKIARREHGQSRLMGGQSFRRK